MYYQNFIYKLQFISPCIFVHFLIDSQVLDVRDLTIDKVTLSESGRDCQFEITNPQNVKFGSKLTIKLDPIAEKRQYWQDYCVNVVWDDYYGFVFDASTISLCLFSPTYLIVKCCSHQCEDMYLLLNVCLMTLCHSRLHHMCAGWTCESSSLTHDL